MGGKARHRAFVRDGITQGHKEEFYEVEDQRFLGAQKFVDKLQEEHEEPGAKRHRPLDQVVLELGRELGIGGSELKGGDRSWPVSKARTMIGYVLVRRQGYALGKVASYFGRDAATVGILIGRLAARMSEDEALRREIDRLNKKI